MYDTIKESFLNLDFLRGIDVFLESAKMHPKCMDGIKIKCPYHYGKCQNCVFLDENTIRNHLMKCGFVLCYYQWILHGKSIVPNINALRRKDVIDEPNLGVKQTQYNLPKQMVMDAGG